MNIEKLIELMVVGNLNDLFTAQECKAVIEYLREKDDRYTSDTTESQLREDKS